MKKITPCRWFAWIGLCLILAVPVRADVFTADLDLIAPSAETNQWPVRMQELITEGGSSDTQSATATGTISVELDLTIDPGTQVATLNTVSFPTNAPGLIKWNDLGYFIGFGTILDVFSAQATLTSPGGSITPVGGAFPSADVPFTLNGGTLDVFSGPVRDFTAAPVTGVTTGQTGSISVGAPVINGITVRYPVAVTVPVSFFVDSVVSNASYDVNMTVGSDGPPVTVLAATGQLVRTLLEINNDAGASDVTQTTATLNGELVETFGEPTTVIAYWGTSDGGTTNGAWDTPVNLGVQAEGPVSTPLTSLAPDTTYFYRLLATNANGSAWAPETASFTTDPTLSSFTHQLPITFSGYTAAETLTNFPALVRFDEQTVPCFTYDLLTHPATAADLRFADATGQTLKYEIDNWDATGTSAVWVQVPEFSAGTVITAYWGNVSASATPPVYTTDGSTWDDTYVGVWHFSEESGDVLDSSGNGLHGVPMDDVTQGTNGQVGRAVFMNDDAADDGAHIDLTAHIPVIGALAEGTILSTFNVMGNGVDTLFALSDSTDGSSEIRVITESGTYRYDLRDESGELPAETGDLRAPYDVDTWHVGFTVIDQADQGAHYLDGALESSGTEPFLADLATPDTMAFGRNVDSINGPEWGLDGTLDEFRISSALRSSNWVWAATQTILDPDSLLTFGTVSAVDTPIAFNAAATNISPTSAAANGILTCEGVGGTSVRVYWGTADGETTPGAWTGGFVDLGVSAPGPLTTPLGPLQVGTTYFYRFFATNASGDYWTPEAISFTTDSGSPFIDNADGASGQTATSAILNGNLNDQGAPTQVTVYWGATDGGTDPGAWDTPVPFGTTPSGPLATNITGLTENTEYFYRYFASNVNGTAWAPSTESFTTSTDFGDWTFKQRITFDGYARGDAVADIPLMVRFSQSLPTFFYADFAYPNGADLRFADQNGVILNHEIETWDTGGESVVWVQVPRLVDDTTYVDAYWGNAAAGPALPAFATNGATWSAGYLGVWHFNETSGDVLDATGNGLHGIPSNGVVQGVSSLAGRAATISSINSSEQHVDLTAHLTTIGTLPEGSLMSLFRTPDSGINTLFAMSDSTFGSTEVRFITEGVTLRYDVRDEVGTLPSEGGIINAAGITVTDDDWHVGTAVVDSNDVAALYVDGVLGASGTEPFLGDLQNPDTLAFGRNVHSGGGEWGHDGELDEFRISTSLRSSNWNWAVAQNLVDHGAFNSYGLVAGAVLPAIATEAPTSVTATSAVANGTLINAGITSATVTVYYGTSNQGTNAMAWDESKPLGAQTAGPVSTTLDGLTDDTQYYYRFFAGNAAGDAWAPTGSEFVTPPGPLNAADFTKTLELCFDGYTHVDALTNFPALVVLNEGLTGFSYGDFASPAGTDLRFTADDMTTVLPYDVESWNPAGDSHVWVQVPTLTSNTCIHAWWGNPGNTNVPNYVSNGSTWDETYKSVWHLNEAANDGETNVAFHADSTPHGNDATQVGNAATAGRIAGGQDLDGVNDAIRSSERAIADAGPNFAVSLWVNSTDADNGVLYWEQAFGGSGFWSRFEPTANRLRGLIGPPEFLVATTNAYTDGAWHQLYFVAKDGNTLQVYVDGVLEDEVTGATISASTSDIGRIGERPDGSQRLLGQVDEVRIACASRSAGWIWAAYVNQDPSGDIVTYGAVTDLGGPMDSDGDGVSDADEALADTDPGNSNDFFAVKAIVTVGGNLEVTLPTKATRNYVIQWTDDLADTNSWQDLAPAVPGSDGDETFPDPAPTNRALFYRGDVRLP